jgi:glyoxylase-like metal-dependent hydrolase (beta-lactamase superfamily II)
MRVLMETVGLFEENTYFIIDEESLETAVVDPGDEAPRLLEIVRAENLKLLWILNTHAHIDHVGAVAELAEATGAKFHLHPRERVLLEKLRHQADLFGVPCPAIPRIDGELTEGQVFHLGSRAVSIRVLETPGHSPGGVSLEAGGSLFVGDVLFQGSIGRTDLPGGSTDVLLKSIKDRILSFPDSTRVYSGHGPATTVGEERRTNPFLIGG